MKDIFCLQFNLNPCEFRSNSRELKKMLLFRNHLFIGALLSNAHSDRSPKCFQIIIKLKIIGMILFFHHNSDSFTLLVLSIESKL
jgi:hypothetical protein